MPEQIRKLQPPKGVGRLLFRLPIWLYRLRLGRLLGDRMLLLHHTGRTTGLPRQAMLEVAHHDRDTDTYVVFAAFGEKTDWYQNVLAHPDVSIQVGRRKLAVRAEPLSAEERGAVLVDFVNEHPTEARFVSVLGYRVDGTEEDWRALGEKLIAVALRPREGIEG